LITTQHKLLTDEWTGDVRLLETAISRFDARRAPANDCCVLLFEVRRDRHLHVNVTHRYKTKSVRGAGSGTRPFERSEKIGGLLGSGFAVRRRKNQSEDSSGLDEEALWGARTHRNAAVQ
jgi:hypothetical protein